MDRIARGEDVFLLDVREPDEVEAWAYPIGVNIPLGQLGDRLEEIPRERTIVVACHVGGRSAAAAQALSDAGWSGREPHGRGRGVGGGDEEAKGGKGEGYLATLRASAFGLRVLTVGRRLRGHGRSPRCDGFLRPDPLPPRLAGMRPAHVALSPLSAESSS